jgi:prepilin-type N-terminal cleavage/methylation domain-containing protein/prepilin-type processing-associated H-X9-DG protein
MQLKQKNHDAFTLIELLVVIAIIVGLAGLIVPSVRKGVERSRVAVCQNRLRNIGNAIQMFMNDHRGHIPGPLARGQIGVYANRSDMLIYHVGQYMGLSDEPSLELEESFCCPSWLKKTPRRDNVVWWINNEVEATDGSRLNPWGYAFAKDPQSSSTYFRIKNTPDTMAIMDIDRQMGAPWPGATERPLHGDLRNILYFDWHVESLSLDYVATLSMPGLKKKD